MSSGTATSINNLANVWAKIEKAREEYAAVTEQPEGSVTIREYADHFGLAYATASGQIEKLCKTGKMRRIRGLAPDESGVMRRTNFYTPTEK